MMIEVIEIRKAANGYIVSCLEARGHEYLTRGYKTYVCGETAKEVGDTVLLALTENPITMDSPIPPARLVP